MNLSEIPTAEILQDRVEALADITACELALKVCATTYSRGSVADRLALNRRQIEVMDEELARRAAPAGSEARE